MRRSSPDIPCGSCILCQLTPGLNHTTICISSGAIAPALTRKAYRESPYIRLIWGESPALDQPCWFPLTTPSSHAILDSCPSQGYIPANCQWFHYSGRGRQDAGHPQTASFGHGIRGSLDWAYYTTLGDGREQYRHSRWSRLEQRVLTTPECPRLTFIPSLINFARKTSFYMRRRSKRKGYLKSNEVVLGSSGHCSHVLEAPGMYWSSVAISLNKG